MGFEFATAGRILFGAGAARAVAAAAKEAGERALVVTRRSREAADRLLKQLETAGVSCLPFAVAGEPTLDIVSSGLEQARRESCDLVIGLGGGSVLDTGKAIAALLTNPGEPLDYLELVGRGQPLRYRAAPFIAVPTTAGTGSEVTRNAVLGSPEHRTKVSLRSPLMLPLLAVVDPELALGLPPAVTASTGLDNSVDRALCFGALQPPDGWVLPGRVAMRSPFPTPRLSPRRGRRRTDRDGTGQSVGWPVARQRGLRDRAWVRRTHRRHVSRAARRGLCGPAPFRNGG